MKTQESPILEWLDDSGCPIEQDFVPGAVDPGEGLRDAAHWIAEQVDHAQAVTAASGPRLGVDAGIPLRRGSSEEIVKPLHVRPDVALAIASRGDVFEPAMSSVTVDSSSLEVNQGWCSWTATVATRPWRRRSANLRMGPSPSGNLTVIQLVPKQTCRVWGRAFLRKGVPAVAELSTRISKISATT